eukprot:2432706-Rhodomonas_salina.1
MGGKQRERRDGTWRRREKRRERERERRGRTDGVVAWTAVGAWACADHGVHALDARGMWVPGRHPLPSAPHVRNGGAGERRMWKEQGCAQWEGAREAGRSNLVRCRTDHDTLWEHAFDRLRAIVSALE